MAITRSHVLAQISLGNHCKVTNGGCPTYDEDVAHLIRPLADRVAAFFRFGPRDRGWWCGRCGAPPASS